MNGFNQEDGKELCNGFRVYRQLHRSRGWQARFAVRGERYVRYFADAAYGSSEAARRAAEQFALKHRDAHEELLALRRRFDVRRNSRSGVPGVARYDGDGERGAYWLAYWDDASGRRTSRRFSVRLHGEAEAHMLALKTRAQGVDPFRKRYEEILAELELELANRPESLPKRKGRKTAS
jgi:hypothetical protein